MIAPTVAQVSMPEKMKYVTAEELLRMPRSERYELVKGALVEMSPPPGTEHGSLAFQLSYLIGHFVKQHELGRVFAAETGFRLARNPDTVRAADVAFVAKSRLPAKLPKGYLDLAPDLVAEIVSPGDDPDDTLREAKVKEWLDAGVRLVAGGCSRSAARGVSW